MYLGNSQLRSANESIEYSREMLEETIKCKTDIIYFAEKYFYIVTIDEGRRLIELWDFQKKMLKSLVESQKYDGENKRHVIIKMPRQQSKTTIMTIYILWYSLFNKDKAVAILAHKEDTSKEILERIKFAYKLIPLWLQQGIVDGGWSKKSIRLSNGVKIMAASTASDTISGETISLLYMDEFAKVKTHIAEEFITSTYPVISSGKKSKIIITSSPLGLNHFYEFWTRAVQGKSNFFPISVGWWEHPDRDKKWKEDTIKDIGKVRFAQEYECKFLGSSETLIDSDILEQCIPQDAIELKWGGSFQIYEKPVQGFRYIVASDSAKGTGADYSVIQVLKTIDSQHLEQVAVYRNNMIGARDFAQVCISVSKYYNNAPLMVENNAEGATVCDVIWHEYEYENLINLDKKGLGIRSTKSTKLTANILLKEYMEKGYLKIVDARTIYELSRYEEINPNVFACPRDVHDDCVSSLLWAIYFIKTPYFDGEVIERDQIEDKYKIENVNTDNEPPIIIYDG